MADCENSCAGSCQGSCQGTCEGTCYTTCYTTCSGTCKYTCEGTCSDACTACTGNCQGSCHTQCGSNCCDSCYGNCWEKCSESCYITCRGQCKGYCSNICQTYCEKEQTFVKNRDPIANSVGTPEFSWTYPVTAPTDTGQEGSTIKITASEWNTLKSYIQEAVKYCGGKTPSGPDASDDPDSEHNIISAKKYNDLADGLEITRVEVNQLISASVINALKNTYNTRKIKANLPNGQYTGYENQCCQNNQVCMEQGELLLHQYPITSGCKLGQQPIPKPQ